MGRTKKTVDSGDTTTKGLDAKSKAIEKAKGRQAREKVNKSYREASDSEESEQEVVAKFNDPKDKDFSGDEVSISEESDSAGESSGSEYGKKKKTPSKIAKGKGRGKSGKKAASPKGKGRGRGRAAARNGSKKPLAKRGRADSDESESEAESSGSEFGKKKISPKKRGPPPKASPKRKAAVSSPAEGRSRRGRQASAKSYKEVSEDDVEEVSEEEKKPVSKRAKLDTKPKEKAKKESEPEEEEDQSIEEEEEKEDLKVKKNGSAKKKEEVVDSEEEEEEEEEDKESKKSDDDESEDEKSPVSENDAENHEKSTTTGLKNRTDTDYSKIDFESDKKTSKGDPWNYKISCWNIGGIKSWVKKNGMEFIKKENPDVMCLVEVRCNETSKPEELSKIEGYPHAYWSFNSENAGHHGVAILSKTEAKNVQLGFPINDSDSSDDKKSKDAFSKEGRMITLEFENFFLINAYVPNSGRHESTEKYPPKVANGERQKFDKLFRELVKDYEKKKPVIVTGDLNVSHQEIDLANPKKNERTAGFTKEEREGMTQLLEETTLFDSFRALYPDKKASYTFWSYMHNSRQKNIGWRLDYFLLSEKLRDSLCESVMRSEVYGSDHCPITLFIKN